MRAKITVMLVDDHAIVRAGFKLLLAMSNKIAVIAEADCGEQALSLYQESQPDIVVLDLSMPGIGGLETIKRLLLRDEAIKILVFSMHDESVYVSRALNAGAKGYITKNSAPEILLAAIKSIQDGNNYIEQGLLNATKGGNLAYDYQSIIHAFSSREFDVFRLLAKGLTTHKIAIELCISYKTAANYVTQIKKKMHITSVAELAHIAVLLGMMKL